ncbi:MAG: hypothetical protein BAJATHORv1_20589 [Candidatus Thorarchaeota archaeon]|nr:MAG: hypothetical protein BAJATHORv1_20589 [Candidatus Thorarchaeota archaeon]
MYLSLKKRDNILRGNSLHFFLDVLGINISTLEGTIVKITGERGVSPFWKQDCHQTICNNLQTS